MKQEITSPSSMKLEDLKPDIQDRIRRHVHPLAEPAGPKYWKWGLVTQKLL